jgi:hypothetical protein
MCEVLLNENYTILFRCKTQGYNRAYLTEKRVDLTDNRATNLKKRASKTNK